MFLENQHGQSGNADLLAHCKRELYHAVLRLIYNEEFVSAYKDGIIVTFPDGISRLAYLRLITHSADYPEKQVSFIVVMTNNY